MDRSITQYHQDEDGHWIAELDCGHSQHIRHTPPWQLRPWVLTAEGRGSMLGRTLRCPLCDAAQMGSTKAASAVPEA